MAFQITVKTESGVSKTKRLLFEEATTYFLEKLMAPNFLKDMRVHLFVAGPRLVDKAYGTMEPTAPMGIKKPRSFAVQLSTAPRLLFCVRSLAHECVHIKQYRLGEFRYDDKYCYWKGKRMPYDAHREIPKSTSSWEDYYNRPWEIEAYGCERGLTGNFLFDRRKKLYEQWMKDI